MKNLVLAILTLLCAVSLPALGKRDGSDLRATEERHISGVRGVRLDTSGTLTITQGSNERLTISGDDNLLKWIVTPVKDGILTIRRNRRIRTFYPAQRLVYELTVPDIHSIELRGSGHAFADRLQGDILNVEITGSGDLEIGNLQLSGNLDVVVRGSGGATIGELKSAKDVRLRTTGSGDISITGFQGVQQIDSRITGAGSQILKGTSRELQIKSTGAGDLRGQEYRTDIAVVDLMASGGVEIASIEQSVSGRLAGSGDLIFGGNPGLVSIKSSGSGRVIRK